MRKNKPAIILRDILVENYAAEGKSLARHDGKVIFMQGAVPGDVVDIRLTKNKKDWAEGVVTEVKKYAAERTEPFCSHFGICGGCQWQMLPYKEQLKYKEQQVLDQLQRIAKIPLPTILPILGCDET
ncbi:MAG: TRAM domain-containing protein, partial [Chitinophagaceae bacterium]